MNKNNTISSLYCRKCKLIPLIQVNPKENDVIILTSCNCHQQLLKSDIFLKNYYKPEININEIKESKKFKYSTEKINENIKKLIKNYQLNKEKFETNCLEIKDKLINIFKMAIKKIESVYESNKEINNKIDKIIQILIQNYNLNPKNEINIKNIISNTQLSIKNNLLNINFNYLTDLMKNINNCFNDNYIIKSNKLKLISTFIDTNPHKLIIELKENIFASKYNNNFIKVFKLKNNDECFSFKVGQKINNLLIDENKKYLISVNDYCFIKFWDINEIVSKLKPNNDNKIMSLFPSYEFENEKEILELINLENNLLCGCDNKNICIYKYDINEKDCEILKKLEINAENLMLIKRKNKANNKYICCKDENYLIIIEASQLKIIDKIKIGRWIDEKFCYEQINDDEIIIGIDKSLKIINLDKNKITLSKNINFNIMCIKKLNDYTILVGGRSELKRFCIKKLEELPKIITLDNDNYIYYDDDDEFFPGLVSYMTNRDDRDIQSINELSNGKIMLILRYDINIYGVSDD